MPVPTLAILTLLIVAFSCKLREDDATTATAGDGAQPNSAMQAAPSSDGEYRLRMGKADAQDSTQVGRNLCLGPGGPSTRTHWHLNFESAFGRHTFDLTPSEEDAQGAFKVSLDGSVYQLSELPELSREALEPLCTQLKSRPEWALEPDSPLAGWLRDMLSAAVPDCRFGITSLGTWACSMRRASLPDTLESLRDLPTIMTRRWNRQPYLFSRRIFVTTMLAEVLTQESPETHLSRVCRVLDHSSPEELPVVMTSSRWVEATCKNPDPERAVEVAGIGLARAYGEISFLRSLLEATSPEGSLLVHLPKASITTRDIWVQLTPTPSVTERLLAEAAALWHDDEVAAQGVGTKQRQSRTKRKAPTEDLALRQGDPPRACWHPILGASTDLLAKARMLGIAGNGKTLLCRDGPETSIAEALTKASSYIAQSITSETEFVITNGKSKFLRIPRGNYDVRLWEFTGNIEERPSDPQLAKASTTIEWKDARRRIQITDATLSKGARPL